MAMSPEMASNVKEEHQALHASHAPSQLALCVLLPIFFLGIVYLRWSLIPNL